MKEPIAGKFLLEILSTGMYGNPLHIFREYIQNAADAIDAAIYQGIITKDEAEINIVFNKDNRTVSIRDNGTGISKNNAMSILLSVGDSDKDPDIFRGFRGIGRLGGLGYANKIFFITSAKGEPHKTIMSCDCVLMRQLLRRENSETNDIIDTFKAIGKFSEDSEKEDSHYFEVVIEGVIPGSDQLLDEEIVTEYLASTAPIDFDGQKFVQEKEINQFFSNKGFPIQCYKIFRGTRKLPIYKPYTRSLRAGKTFKTRTNDFVKSIEFVYEETSDGQPLYIGWLAITDFSGQISDKQLQGIRIRKGNILLGDETTFAKYFPAEGEVANKMFAGEIHALHSGLIPDSQRDDFEANDIYLIFKEKLSEWARQLNKTYRRGTSEVTSALRKINELNEKQQELEQQVNTGKITSDIKREKITEELDRINRSREKEEKAIKKAIEKGSIDGDRMQTIKEAIKKSQDSTQKAVNLSNKIISADYATKDDLPSSYSRIERKIYQRIIEVIDQFFSEDHNTADKLRKEIRQELSNKRK